jgi:hypothetical protein
LTSLRRWSKLKTCRCHSLNCTSMIRWFYNNLLIDRFDRHFTGFTTVFRNRKDEIFPSEGILGIKWCHVLIFNMHWIISLVPIMRFNHFGFHYTVVGARCAHVRCAVGIRPFIFVVGHKRPSIFLLFIHNSQRHIHSLINFTCLIILIISFGGGTLTH